jgi:hypothetical protein
MITTDDLSACCYMLSPAIQWSAEPRQLGRRAYWGPPSNIKRRMDTIQVATIVIFGVVLSSSPAVVVAHDHPFQ